MAQVLEKVSMEELTKNLQTLFIAKDAYTVFKDFVKITAITINNSSTVIKSKEWEDNENEYLKVINTYSKEEQHTLTKCIALLISVINKDVADNNIFKDWLGELYMKLGISNKDKGQFFTPYSVGKMMAEINFKNIDELKQKEVITVNDPCVGGGCLPIACCDVLYQNNINYQNKMLVVAQDNDERCFYMTYIQLSLLGCPARVELKDTLLNKNLGMTWDTPFLKMQYLKFKKYLTA